MSDVHQFTNEPVEIQIGEQKIKVKKLGPVAILALAQSKVRSQRIAEIQQALRELGLEKDERVEFALKSMDAIPKGDELEMKAMNWINTVEGTVCCLHKAMIEAGEDITENQVFQLVDKAIPDELAMVNREIMDKNEVKEDEEENPTKDQC